MSGSHPSRRPISRTISRRRRRTRLRSTALPTFFDTVKPTRAGPSSLRLRACSTKGRRRRLASGCCRQEIGALLQSFHGELRRHDLRAVIRGHQLHGAEPLASARRGAPRPPCGRPWSPCGCESRGGACAPACSVDRSASRLSSPLAAPWRQDWLAVPGFAMKTREKRPDRHAICAAYKGGGPARQCEAQPRIGAISRHACGHAGAEYIRIAGADVRCRLGEVGNGAAFDESRGAAHHRRLQIFG